MPKVFFVCYKGMTFVACLTNQIVIFQLHVNDKVSRKWGYETKSIIDQKNWSNQIQNISGPNVSGVA